LEGLKLFLERLFKNKKEVEIDTNRLPVHIAIIMDGNGRWAQKRGLTRSIGHREGSGTLKKLVGFCDDIGIKYLTVYAFSTENWKRPENEVNSLMSLLLNYLKNAEKELGGRNIRIRVIGDIKGLSGEIQEEIERVTISTRNNKGLTLNIALNYGSRDEMVSALKRMVQEAKEGKLGIEEINEIMITDRLYTTGIPDPDLLIRTGGEKRLSNFLLWQSAYTELWFSDELWPDFSEEHILEAIKEFQKRNRRYGGI